MTVLVLAGTGEASALVEQLVDAGVKVVASLAGRTASPRQLPCPVRVGGFRGVDGLVSELRARDVHALVDATHPFADEMPWHARDAAARTAIPHLRLVRPPWPSRPGWTEVDDVVAAAGAVTGRALVTLGRQELHAFRALPNEVVVRSVDAPPAGPWTVVLGRGPFGYEDELALLRSHRIDTVVTRNSGGPAAKLDAADTIGARVVVIRRPRSVDAPTVGDAAAAARWVLSLG
jgi:precorrin-6A/cobalt-precorrin-6A reductase